MAYEASAAEGSDASGALSDSTGVSPGQIAVGSGAAVTSGRPFLAGASGRQRSVGGHSASGSSLGREAGVAVLPSAAAAGLHASTLADAAHSQHTPSGVSFASSYGSSLLDGGAHPAVAALMGAPSLAARSDSGSADPAAVYTGELHECLLCRQHTCFPTGPATIRWVLPGNLPRLRKPSVPMLCQSIGLSMIQLPDVCVLGATVHCSRASGILALGLLLDSHSRQQRHRRCPAIVAHKDCCFLAQVLGLPGHHAPRLLHRTLPGGARPPRLDLLPRPQPGALQRSRRHMLLPLRTGQCQEVK